jgi:Ca-activated chloride channel family protein
VTLTAPWVLLGIVPVIALAVVDLVRPWRAPRARKLAAVAWRVVLLTALLVGLAGPQARWAGDPPTWVFVLDRSASVDDAALAEGIARIGALADQVPAGARRALVVADGSAEVTVGPDDPWALPVVGRGPRAEATDLGAAVQLALALVDPAAGGRVVLVTDAADTGGALAAATASARAQGVPVDAVRLRPAAGAVALLDVELPTRVVRPGATLVGRAVVRGPPGGGAATLRVDVSGEGEATVEGMLPDGALGRLSFEVPIAADAAPGPREVRVLLEDGGGADAGVLTTAVTVGPPPTVLVVSDEEREVAALVGVFTSQGFEVRRRAAHEARTDDLPTVDLVVLGDVPAVASPSEPRPMPDDFVAALRRWVSAGGGLITLGGDRTYELGGWGATPLAHVLPLDLAAQAEDVEPPATVVHLLDNSASMGDWTGHQRKMALANEATVASMRLLRPKDAIGVFAVNTEVRSILPIQQVDDPARLAAAIRGIKPSGGGIYVYSALVAAERALAGVDTPIQHVLVYSDAQDAEEKVAGLEFGWGPGPNAFQVASRLRARGATVSVIALGDPRDQDVPFLRELAGIGGGRFGITRDASELTALFVEETRQIVRSVVRDTAFRARLAAPHPALLGVDLDQAPPLYGYVQVKARDTATVVIEGPGQVPILATWQYGLGQVATLSTDLGGRWGRDWTGWDGYPRFVAQLARWALRPPTARGAAIDVGPHPEGALLEVQRLGPDGLALVEGGLRLRAGAGDEGRDVVLRPVVPGRWRGVLAGAPGEALALTLLSDGAPIAEETVVVPEPPERRAGPSPAVDALLAETGGVADPDRLLDASAAAGRPTDVSWLLVLFAALLLPFDAWLRRPARRP